MIIKILIGIIVFVLFNYSLKDSIDNDDGYGDHV